MARRSAGPLDLLLLLALGMGLVGVRVGGLRMLLCGIRMLLALRMIALAVVLCGGTVRLGRVFVMFRGLIMFVSSHLGSPCLTAPSGDPKHLLEKRSDRSR
jgi:hypothetical protein